MSKICKTCNIDCMGTVPCTNESSVYYVSTKDNSYTNDSTPISFYRSQPKTSVIPSRTNIGNFELYINGFKNAILFVNKIDQINYLKSKGLIK